MKKRLIVPKFLIIMLLCLVVVSGSVLAATINVPSNEATIQSAINSAVSGDTILVAADTYTENLAITKSVNLIGTDVTIQGVHTITANDVSLSGFTFDVPGSGTAITIDSAGSAINNIEIVNNIFDLEIFPSVGVHIGGATPTNKITNVLMKNNIFNGPFNKVCNPWKIGGQFGTPISAEIDTVYFENNIVNRCSIPINLHKKNIKNILINKNIFKNTDGVLYIWNDDSTNPTGVLSDFVFTNNDVDSSNTYGIGIDTAPTPVFDDVNFGNGNRINENNFVNIVGDYGFKAVTVKSSLSTNLNVEDNWWGDIDPSDDATGSVDYTPWYIDSSMSTLNTVTEDLTSIKNKLNTNLDAAVSTRASQESVDVINSNINNLNIPDPTSALAAIETKLDDGARFTDDSELNVIDTKINLIESKLDISNNFKADVSNLDAAVSTRATQASVDAIEGKLDNPNNFKADVNGLASQTSVDTVGADVDAIESKIDSLNIPNPTAALDSIENKLDTPNFYKANVTNLDTTISSRASQTTLDAIESKLDSPTNGLRSIALLIQSIQTDYSTILNTINNIVSIVTGIDTKVDAIESKLDTNLDAAISSRASQTSLDSNIDELKNGLNDIETKLNDGSDKGDINDLDNKLDLIENKIDALEAKLDQLIGGEGARCGNSIKEGTEECDDGNNLNGDGCSGTCSIEECGNNRLEYGEECDDNNLVSGDGCNLFCQIEECTDDGDCQDDARCNDVYVCVGGAKTVIFRTNVEKGNYFKCSRQDNCWIAFDYDNDGDLDPLGFDGKSTECNGGIAITETPEGLQVLDYGHTSRVRICDGEGREIRFNIDRIPQDVELVSTPTEPFTSNKQETLV